jgi:tetraacyldisaccharide 4'-kinase
MKYLLYPFALIFYIFLLFRKFLYSIKICKRYTPPITTISVGNLSLGGNGKTPHTIYTARLLINNGYHVAIILRGYKRKTHGFIEVDMNATVDDVGDEALIYKRNFGNALTVAVCENRAKGIKILLNQYPQLDVILLDDAMQHLGVKPQMQLLLSDYSHPFYKDHLLPVGRLREPRSAYKRADAIIITKFPAIFSPILFNDISQNIQLLPNQKLFLSYIFYKKFIPVFDKNLNNNFESKNPYVIFAFTAIANYHGFNEYLLLKCKDLVKFNFPDHHQFTEKDIIKLIKSFNDYPSTNKIIVTTEKDVPRLEHPSIKNFLVDLPIYYVPIDVRFHHNAHMKLNYDKYIIDYVRQNQANNRIS